MILHASDFNLQTTIDSGQVFGFSKHPDGSFEGSIGGGWLRLSQMDKEIQVTLNGVLIPEEKIRSFFDLDRDLSPLYQILKSEMPLAGLAVPLNGLRVIRQEPWDALAGFILSSNNNIKRIQGIWTRLCERYSGNRFLFPSAEKLAKASEKEFREIGLGYRAPFLLKTAQMVHEDPERFSAIKDLDYEAAQTELIRFPGVGEKIADCVLLFGFQKYEAFPVDVWIWRVMRKLYFRNRKIPEKKVQLFGQKRWGKQAGYIQQYIYHGVRIGLI